MTLDRQHGAIVFQCDSCDDLLETGTGNWESAMNLFRREGWKARKDDDSGVWEHYCQDCKR